MASGITDEIVRAAIAAINSEPVTPAEKIAKLLKMALDLQRNNQETQLIHSAIELYLYAIELCGSSDHLFLRAQAMTGLATALRSLSSDGPDILVEARRLYEGALGILREHAAAEEIARTEMNLGIVLQALVPLGKASVDETVQAYQRALRVFTGDRYPKEHVTLQNNLAIAYLLSPLPAPDDPQRQLVLQTFEEALHWVTRSEHPVEYAMLQNNLGNALQYLPSHQAIENGYRAIAAYDEALKVRDAIRMPLEYASTIANKANILANLPDDREHPEWGNPRNLAQALQYCHEARELFMQHRQVEQAKTVSRAIRSLTAKLKTYDRQNNA